MWVQDRFGDTHHNWMGETVQIVTLLASVLMSLALTIGCADSAEQRLRLMQNELERVLHTALRDGDIRMQRTSDHLTVVIAERLLFDAGSRELKPDGIEMLKQMGVLFKNASLMRSDLSQNSFHYDQGSDTQGANYEVVESKHCIDTLYICRCRMQPYAPAVLGEFGATPAIYCASARHH
jgi:hypothetical protein